MGSPGGMVNALGRGQWRFGRGDLDRDLDFGDMRGAVEFPLACQSERETTGLGDGRASEAGEQQEKK